MAAARDVAGAPEHGLGHGHGHDAGPDHAIIVACEYPPFPGGIATYAGRLAQTLTEQGIRVLAITPHYPGISGPVPAHVEQYAILAHHTITRRAVPRLLRVLRAAPVGTPVLAADIRSAMLLWLLRPFHCRPYRVMVHGSEASKLRGTGPLAAIARRAYAGAQAVIYNSQATRAIFRACGVVPGREAVSYLGVDRGWFEPADDLPFDEPLLAALDPAVPLLCSVGRIEARKGQADALRAIAHAQSRLGLGEVVYVVAGRVETAAYGEEISALAQRLGVRLLQTGRLGEADVKRLYARARTHLLCARAMPGRIEGFGLVLLEAAAQGCPSIATRVGGIPEVLGDTGALVAEGDIAALALALTRMVIDPQARSEAGAAARQRAAGFCWESCAAKTFPELALMEKAPQSGLHPVEHALPHFPRRAAHSTGGTAAAPMTGSARPGDLSAGTAARP